MSKSEVLGRMVLPSGWELRPGYKLAIPVTVEFQMSAGGVLAITRLETVEYGWGVTKREAANDLMASLVEYMESLESRQGRLSKKALLDLNRLHQLIQR